MPRGPSRGRAGGGIAGVGRQGTTSSSGTHSSRSTLAVAAASARFMTDVVPAGAPPRPPEDHPTHGARGGGVGARAGVSPWTAFGYRRSSGAVLFCAGS